MPDDSRRRAALDDLLGQPDLPQRLVRLTELCQSSPAPANAGEIAPANFFTLTSTDWSRRNLYKCQ